MDSGLEAIRTYDDHLIKAIMTLPEMWATVAEDGQSPVLYEPNVEDEAWVLITKDGGEELIGAYRIHSHNSVTVEIHAQILPEHRKEHGKESGRTILKWILDNADPDCQKVIAQIPEIYPNVINFTKGQGFKEEGVNRLSYKKNGIIVDQVLLGITRSEIESVLGV